MLFLGDWIPRRGLETDLLSNTQIKIVNLECVIAGHVSNGQKKAYPIILDDSARSVLRATRNLIVNVANNHTCDAGNAAFTRFLRILDEASIPYYGTVDKPFCEVVREGKKHVIIAGLFKCSSRCRHIARLEDIASCVRLTRSCAEQIIVTPHWGVEGEYTPYPSPAQRALARRWIDAGASAVFGHHSHTIQAIEWCEGKPIVYSLGNFHFPHEESWQYPLTRFGLGVELTAGTVLKRVIFEHRGGLTTLVSDAIKVSLVNDYVQRISQDLAEKAWTRWRWARSVGRLYTNKNAASWRLRFKNRFYATLPRWLVVQLMPRTLLMRMGKLFECPEARLRYASFDRIS